MKKIFFGLFLAVVSVALVQVGCDPKATPAAATVPGALGLPAPTISTYASGLSGAYGIVGDSSGNLYVSEYNNGTIVKITPSGTQSTFASGFNHVRRLAIDGTGNIYVADTRNYAVEKITPAGVVTTLVQNPFSYFRPRGVAVGKSGTVYVTGGYRYPEVWTLSGGTLTPLATGFGTASGVAVDSTGIVYMCDPSNGNVNKIVNGVTSPFVTSLSKPSGIVVDNHGNVVFTDRNNGTLNLVTPAGSNRVLSSSFSSPAGVFTTDGKTIYVVDGSVVKKVIVNNWP